MVSPNKRSILLFVSCIVLLQVSVWQVWKFQTNCADGVAVIGAIVMVPLYDSVLIAMLTSGWLLLRSKRTIWRALGLAIAGYMAWNIIQAGRGLVCDAPAPSYEIGRSFSLTSWQWVLVGLAAVLFVGSLDLLRRPSRAAQSMK